MTTQTELGDFDAHQLVTDGGQIEWEEGEENLRTSVELKERDDVRLAVADYEDCDVAVLVDDGTNVGPIRKAMSGFTVADVTDYSDLPYVLFKFSRD